MIGTNYSSAIQQIRQDVSSFVRSSQQAESGLYSLESAGNQGANAASSAVSTSSYAARDTAETDSSSTGQSMQSAIRDLVNQSGSVSSLGSQTLGTVSGCSAQIYRLVSDLSRFTSSLAPSAMRSQLEGALAQLQSAQQHQGKAESSLGGVNWSMNSASGDLRWADGYASTVAQDGPGQDVSSAASSAASSLTSVQNSFGNVADAARMGRYSQTSATSCGSSALSYLDQAAMSGDSLMPTSDQPIFNSTPTEAVVSTPAQPPPVWGTELASTRPADTSPRGSWPELSVLAGQSDGPSSVERKQIAEADRQIFQDAWRSRYELSQKLQRPG